MLSMFFPTDETEAVQDPQDVSAPNGEQIDEESPDDAAAAVPVEEGINSSGNEKVGVIGGGDNNKNGVPTDQGEEVEDENEEEVEENNEDKDVVGEMPSFSTNDTVTFVDHFSLRNPSSKVRFRGARVMVYEDENVQFLVEDRLSREGKHTVTVKRLSISSFGLNALRTGYTLTALLMLGFLFVFCFQMILFLLSNLPVAGGATSGTSFEWYELAGTIFAFPLLLYAMGSTMALGSAFVKDTWRGHSLFRAVMNWGIVTMEWTSFIIFLGIPLLSIMITLMMGLDSWWETSAKVWMSCIAFAFAVFCFAVMVRELGTCFDLVSISMDKDPTSPPQGSTERRWGLIKRAALLTLTQRFSGTRSEKYLVEGKEDYPVDGYASSSEHVAAQTRTSLYSKMTQLRYLRKVFETLNPPVKKFTVDEMRDIVPFVTTHNWSLEKMYCKSENDRTIYAVKGPSALSSSQVSSSFVCLVIGLVLMMSLVAGVLVWLEKPGSVTLLIVLVIGVCCVVPALSSARMTYETYGSAQGTTCGGEHDDMEAIYQVWESVTVTRPRSWYCWTRLTIEIILFFIFPLVSLYNGNNLRLATLFLVVGLFSGLRLYFDASSVLTELGSVGDLTLTTKAASPKETSGGTGWIARTQETIGSLARTESHRELLIRSRTSEIIGNVTHSHAVGRWMWVFGIAATILTVMLLQAEDLDVVTPEGGRPPIVLLDDFYYPPQPDLPYPSCELTKGFDIPGAGSSSLGDFAFMSALAYEYPVVSQHSLDQWFGPGTVIDEDEFVANYRSQTNTVDNPVYYKLFSFADLPGYGIVSIRGSETMWDFLVDIQIWSSAFLAQVVQALMPFGWIWTSILDDLVTVVNSVQSETLRKVAYYRRTTDFVNALLEEGYTYGGKSFQTLRVTGASLGGGLAIITGAQTNANAVAISGFNAVLSRHTFTPRVTEEQLNARVFNVIPDRDIIAATGGRSRLFQEIQCRAPKNSLTGCHSMWRSLCEISYTCGTGDRPVLCRCVSQFGYPEPLKVENSNSTRTFSEACEEEEDTLRQEVGDDLIGD